eukprot:scaffold2315_cov145-Isochrysis_galbana.AAC.6
MGATKLAESDSWIVSLLGGGRGRDYMVGRSGQRPAIRLNGAGFCGRGGGWGATCALYVHYCAGGRLVGRGRSGERERSRGPGGEAARAAAGAAVAGRGRGHPANRRARRTDTYARLTLAHWPFAAPHPPRGRDRGAGGRSGRPVGRRRCVGRW